jgi:transposase, IS6 family
MSDFKWRHFRDEIIPWAVRWYCKDGISCREREELMTEGGLRVDHTTISRWVQHCAPEMEKRSRWYLQKLPAPELARGRDLCRGQRPLGLSVPGSR